MSTNNLATTTRSATAAVDYFPSTYDEPAWPEITPDEARKVRCIAAGYVPAHELPALFKTLGIER